MPDEEISTSSSHRQYKPSWLRSSGTRKLVRSVIKWLRSLFKSRQKKTKVVPFIAEDGGDFEVEESDESPPEWQVVIKYIKRSLTPDYCCPYDSKYGVCIPSEISILARLNHPNVVEILEFSRTPSSFILVMPTHGEHAIDLRQFISRLVAIDEPFCSYSFRQIVSGVHHLHKSKILHGDIKADNVIINERFHCKLIDFGSASYFTENNFMDHFAGSLSYCAPEAMSNGRYRGLDAEMYALGVVLYLLNFQDYPIDPCREFTEYDENLQGASDGLRKLIDRLLDANYHTRCKMPELLENQWLNQSFSIDDYEWDKMVLM